MPSQDHLKFIDYTFYTVRCYKTQKILIAKLSGLIYNRFQNEIRTLTFTSIFNNQKLHEITSSAVTADLKTKKKNKKTTLDLVSDLQPQPLVLYSWTNNLRVCFHGWRSAHFLFSSRFFNVVSKQRIIPPPKKPYPHICFYIQF